MQIPRLRDGPRGLVVLRVVVVALLVVTTVSVTHSVLTNDVAADTTAENGLNATLVAVIDGTGPGQIVAYGPSGDVRYRNESHWLYHDVDPSPVGESTVTYVASRPTGDAACPGPGDGCLRNVVERVNLSTGNVTRLYADTDSRNGSTQTHDVDRVNDSVFLVADISYPDRVYMVNVTTGEEIWEWRVSAAFAPESGGEYPSDWTHLNDVEHLPDGRVMANLRNQDQVVFIEPGEGIQPAWTLGADDELRTLYEPHNPDYVPAARGGPAVVVADSENNRLVEYQRADGEWVRTWRWRDARLQWPRDADRLSNGNTLVADSHGSRLLSVAPNGSVAWARAFPDGGYDVEVLGTGPESASGESARRLGLDAGSPRGNDAVQYAVVSVVPPLVMHGLLYALPTWASAVDAFLVLCTGLAVLGLFCGEFGIRLRRRQH
jgi:hypothetical protein